MQRVCWPPSQIIGGLGPPGPPLPTPMSRATIRAQSRCTPSTILLVVSVTLKRKILLYVFPFLSGVSTVNILHIEIYVAFDFDPSFTSRLITDISFPPVFPS